MLWRRSVVSCPWTVDSRPSKRVVSIVSRRYPVLDETMTTENHSHAAHVVFQQRGSCLVAKLLWHRLESPDVAGAVGRSLT